MLDGTADKAAELKSQGALEASRDPNSNVDARAAEETMMREAKAAGAGAYEFDPNATPEQKKAQMRAQAPVDRPHRKHQTAALVSDQDDGQTAGYDLPPPSKEGALAAGSPTDANGTLAKDDDGVYSKTGWAPRFGNPGDEDEGTMLDHQDFLEGKLDDKFFGDWYHNAGVIVFACLSSWVVAVLGGGLGWVFLVMAICGTYYRTSLRRVRRNFRDDVNREMSKARLETDVETLEWINSFLAKFWPIYAPVICATIISSVDQVLSTSTPGFLDSMRMKFFTLGTKPPRLEHVKTYPRAEDDLVIMDWKFSFTPNDTADLTARQIKNKVNPKVVLEVRVGKAMLSKGLDIIVEDMACSGTMRVKVKLQLPFPHIERVEICFLGKPTFDFVCKPIGGDMLGFDMVGFLPGLESFIHEQIHAVLAPMMYDPNVFPIEIAKMLAGNPVDQAIGVLQLTFHGAHGLKNPDKFAGTPDPYAVVSINNREALGKTKTVEQNANPRWNETVNIILTSLREPLTIQVYDYNEYRKDKELGVCTFNLEQLETDTEHENQQLEVIANGRPRGVVQCDIRFFPVLEGQKLEDGTELPPPESSTGIVKFTVEQAKDLDGTSSLGGSLNPYAVLLLNGKEVQVSQKLKRTNNPIWPNASKEMLITDRKKAKLGLVVKDDQSLTTDPILGSYQIKINDMLELMGKGQEWYHLAGGKTGRAKMTLQWKPVALKGALSGGGYITPIGVMRVHFMKATDLKNLDTVGKSDPYGRVLLSGIQKARTVTWKNNLSPQFDEIFYIPVHSAREKLVVEMMDEENVGKDRTLGQIEVAASDYIQQGEDGEYLIHDSKGEVMSTPLRINQTSPPKGTLHFTVAFYPTLNVIDPDDEERDEQEARECLESSAQPSVDGAPQHARNISTNTASTAKSSDNDMAKALANNERDQHETDEVHEQGAPKIRIEREDLTRYESGLIVFKIIDGQLAHTGTHLEVLMDDMLYPAYSTNKVKTANYNFNETGDAMVRELDLSRITLRLVSEVDQKGEDDEEDIKAKITGPTLDTLKRCLYTPTQIALRDSQGRESKVAVSMRYLPVKMQLDPSESFNNAGSLRVEVLDANNLPAADRNGYSDPYCKFELNGQEVHKTKVQKKTLHPSWNEYFEAPVRSRTAADFKVDIYDWDFANKADHLGSAVIDLNVLEPFRAQEVTLNLDGKSGALRLKMLFKPDYVTRSRQGSSTFSGTFSAPGKIIGAPVKGATFVGGGVAKGASFLGNRFKRTSSSNHALPPSQEVSGGVADVRDTSMDVGEANGTNKSLPATPHNRQRSFGQVSQSPAAEQGTATISVLSASGFQEDTKLEVRILHDSVKGLKEVVKTKTAKAKTGEVAYDDETKKVPCNADNKFRVIVRDHHTFSSEDLGEAGFFINDQSSGGTQEVKVGSGVVVIRSSFQPNEPSNLRPPSSAPESPAGKKHMGRLLAKKDRSVTPSG
ncbi:Tricalbin-2 [Vermiconidia calcicola]|uniref:Tricalbin-2 n=1 Tax=Vermiconidia calcicola TaxID=1690605 RepID=A0ACC3MJI1_9PEZI|nr:Tricalbin-2 [Vermiconidia calcicola]